MAEPPPPAFRFSRESQIRIDADGRFWHGGEPVKHPGLARALARWVGLDAQTGRYVLRNGLDWCFVTVDDAPLVVRSVRALDDGFELELSDEARERLDPATLRIDARGAPYCTVRSGTLPASFSRSAAFALLEHGEMHGDQAVLVLPGGARAALPSVATGEGARIHGPM